MDSEALKHIIIEQKEIFLSKKNLADRELTSKASQHFHIEHITVITGVRRCGKSSFMSQLAHMLIDQKITTVEQILYVNFEDEKLIDYPASKLNKIIEVFYELNTNHIDKKFLFFDEIQNIPNWEKFVNRLYEQKLYKIFVTGSNAAMLSQEISTSLTGRSLSIELYPFNFQEYLALQKIKVSPTDLYKTQTRSLIKKHFNDYLKHGGFPEYLTNNMYEEILGELYKNIIFRDIIVRHKIKNSKEFREFARYLIANMATMHSYSSLAKVFPNIKSLNSISNYCSFLEEAFLSFSIPMFSPSLKIQMHNARKYYAIDNGMFRQLSIDISDNLGKCFENLVYLTLKKRDCEIYYHKGQYEVDFLVLENKKIELFQVCFDVSNPLTIEREERALLEAMNLYDVPVGIILTNEEESEKIIDTKKIKYIPLVKWILES